MKGIKNHCLIVLQVLLLTLAPRHPALSQVIISSTAESIPVGRIVGQDESITVPTGTSVAVLTSGGNVVWLRGPWSGTYDGTPLEPSVSDRLSALLRPSTTAGSNIAAFRNIAQTGPWEIDPTDPPSRICLTPDHPVHLVAGDLGPNDAVWIAGQDRPDKAAYFRGRRAIDIDTYIRSGDTHLRVRVPNHFAEWQAEIVTLEDPTLTNTPEQLLIALGERGCDYQFATMLASLIPAR